MDLLDLFPPVESNDFVADTFTPEYQGNMYLIEDAMREVGQKPPINTERTAYDNALLKLIDAVPLR